MTPSAFKRPAPNSLAATVLLTALVAFGPVSTDLYLPSLPDIGRAFDTDVAMVQLTLSVFLAGFACAQLAYGPLSDRFGRRPVLLGGIATYFAASLFCLAAQSIEMLILGRFLQALGACCGPVLGRAIVRDVYPTPQAAKVLSYMASAMALAPAVAPIVGGWFHELFGWRSGFVLLAAFGAVLLVASALMLAETNTRPDPEAIRPSRMLANYLSLLTDRMYLGYVLTMSLAFAGMFSFISGSSFVLIDALGLSPGKFGFTFAVVVAGYISGGFIAARATGRLGLDRMIALGGALGTATAAVMAALAWSGVTGVIAVVAPMSVFFLSMALVLPNATAGAIGPYARMAGTASALAGFLQMGAGALAGLAVGRLHDGTARPMMTIILVTSLASLACFRLMVRARNAGNPDG